MPQQSLVRMALAALLSILVLVPRIGPVRTAEAATLAFTVNSIADAPDANPGDGICADAMGQCTLRAAIQEAGAQPRGSAIAIQVPAGRYALSLGTLYLTANRITITGALSSTTTIAGTSLGSVVSISPTVRAIISRVAITGGNAGPSGYGGGIYTAGRLALDDSTVGGNTAVAGGGIANSGGSLVVEQSSVISNVATAYGGGGIQNGGLHNLPGTVAVLGSTIAHNVASGDGGAILNGQNGHPAGLDGLAIPVAARCAQILLCARAVAVAAAPLSQAIATYPLTLTMDGSRVVNNDGDNGGGGVSNDGGTTVVEGSTIDSNDTPDAVGGGISSYGSLTVVDSTISRNQATYGGGIEAFGGGVAGAVTVMSSTLSQNLAGTTFIGGVGGGIDDSATVVTVSGSTLSGNTAGQGGGLEIEGSSSATVRNSTFTGNKGLSGDGGGIQTFSCGSAALSYVTFAANSTALAPSCPDITLSGSILAASTHGPNCTGPITDIGHNLDDGTSCGLGQTTDLTATNPLLGSLANNGGPTPTMALLPNSPAIDRGGTRANGCPLTDQRGLPRPDERGDNGACDMGAYESQGIS